MPGPVSDSYRGPPEDGSYVPTWCYPNSKPKVCPCGHHEGFHPGLGGRCVRAAECKCTGLPDECWTKDEEMVTR